MKLRTLVLSVGCVAFVGGLLLPAPAASAQGPTASPAPAASGAYKIGVVNRKAIFKDYEKQKAEYAKLQDQVKALQKPIDDMSARIEADKKRYEEQKASMSEEARKALEDQITGAFREYQLELKKSQGTIDDMEKRVLQNVLREIDEAVKQIGNAENYHIILEGDPDIPNRVVLYFSDTLNMTPKVIEYLNNRAGTGARPAAARKADTPAGGGGAKKDRN